MPLAVQTLLIGLICLIFSTAWGAVYDGLPPYLSLQKNPYFDIVVGTITDAPVTQGTNDTPPMGILIIDEVLRGKLETGSYSYRIDPPRGASDYESDGQTLKPAWRNESLLGPAKGDRVISFTYVPDTFDGKTQPLLLQGPIIRFSPINRAAIISQMAPPDRSMTFQLPLAAISILLAITSLLARIRPLLSSSRLTRLYVSAGSAAMSLILYGLYENGISNYANIRVDALVLWPALTLSALMLATSLVGLFRR
jgi:hypothetical protein